MSKAASKPETALDRIQALQQKIESEIGSVKDQLLAELQQAKKTFETLYSFGVKKTIFQEAPFAEVVEVFKLGNTGVGRKASSGTHKQVSQEDVLKLVGKSEISAATIAEKVGCSKQTAVKKLEALVKEGKIKRHKGPATTDPVSYSL